MKFSYDVHHATIAELVETARKHHAEHFTPNHSTASHLAWSGVETPEDAYTLAANGWDQGLDETIRIAEEAIATVERENEVPAWHPVWDCSGAAVDIGRYLDGEPECMIEVPPVRVAKVGRVVTLCYSASISGAVSPERIITRGRTIVALALALQRLGYGLEIIADVSAKGPGHDMRVRVTVKGVREDIDPSRLMYALAHPSFLRQLILSAEWDAPKRLHNALGIGHGHGRPTDPVEDLAEGTLYLPAHCHSTDADIAADLAEHLRALDILA